jgi:hypothetical protein
MLIFQCCSIPISVLYQSTISNFCGIVSAWRNLASYNNCGHSFLCSTHPITQQLLLWDQTRQKLNYFTELLPTWKPSLCLLVFQLLVLQIKWTTTWNLSTLYWGTYALPTDWTFQLLQSALRFQFQMKLLLFPAHYVCVLQSCECDSLLLTFVIKYIQGECTKVFRCDVIIRGLCLMWTYSFPK